MWLYLAVTLPLMVVTLAAWFWWERGSAKRAKRIGMDVEADGAKKRRGWRTTSQGEMKEPRINVV